MGVLGAWRSAFMQQELDDLFTGPSKQFSNCTSHQFQLLSYDIVGNIAYTAGLGEHSPPPMMVDRAATPRGRRRCTDGKMATGRSPTITATQWPDE